jgi:hypothetical protein
MTSDSNYWARALPAPPAPELRADAVGYREHMRQTNASAIYSTPEWYGQARPVTRPKIYEQSAPKALGDYVSDKPRSKYLPQDGESTTTYFNRLRGIIAHLADELPADVYEAVVNAWSTCRDAVEGDSHSALRKRLDARTAGENVGIFGQDAKQMATQLRERDQAAHQARFGNAPSYESVSGVNLSRAARAAKQTEVAVSRPVIL